MDTSIIPANSTELGSYFAQQQQTDISDIPQRSGFIPFLGIAYGMSNSVSDGVAAPGDFVFEGKKSFGKKVDVIFADYRLHLSVWDDDTKKTVSDFYDSSANPQRGKNEAFLNFKNQALVGKQKLNDGIDMLFWIPEVSSFAIMYLKGTTYDAFANIFTSGKGGRLITLTSTLKINEKKNTKFYILNCISTNRAVVGSGYNVPGLDIVCDVVIPTDFVVAAMKQFRDAKSTEIASEARDSDR